MYINPHERKNTDTISLKEAVTNNDSHPAIRFSNILKQAWATGENEKICQGLFENYLSHRVKDHDMCLVIFIKSMLNYLNV